MKQPQKPLSVRILQGIKQVPHKFETKKRSFEKWIEINDSGAEASRKKNREKKIKTTDRNLHPLSVSKSETWIRHPFQGGGERGESSTREESKMLEGERGSRQEITNRNSFLFFSFFFFFLFHLPFFYLSLSLFVVSQLTKRWEKREEPFKRR